MDLLPRSTNPKFASSQLCSANAFVLTQDAAKADDIIFNNLPFIVFHSPCKVMHRREKKNFVFCSKCFKIGSHTAAKCPLREPLCKRCTILTGSTKSHNNHCLDCIASGSLGSDCPHPPTCRNCFGPHDSDFPLCPEWSKYKLSGQYLSKFQAALRARKQNE